MINRTLVRTKVIQTLFAYYKKEEQSPLMARKELLNRFSSTYSLYMMLYHCIHLDRFLYIVYPILCKLQEKVHCYS